MSSHAVGTMFTVPTSAVGTSTAGQTQLTASFFSKFLSRSAESHSRGTDPMSPTPMSQHAYVFIHDLVREAVAAAEEVRMAGGRTREPGEALRRLRSWGFLQSLQVQYAVTLVL